MFLMVRPHGRLDLCFTISGCSTPPPVTDCCAASVSTPCLPTTPPACELVHRAFVSHVPYEALAAQLGEYEPLDMKDEKVV